MKDSETFDEFYAKLSDIVNSSFNLGEKIPESKVVGKILRSLPNRFQPKVTAFEEAQDVDNLTLDHLATNLQTYEAHRNFKRNKKILLLIVVFIELKRILMRIVRYIQRLQMHLLN